MYPRYAMSHDILSLKSESKAAFFADRDESIDLSNALWSLKRAKASYVIDAVDQMIYGSDLSLTPEEVAAAEETVLAKGKEPYGDVHYCDNGMQPDGKKRFPCDTPEHVRAAWSYSHHKNVTSKYSSSQLSKLHSCIEKAWKAKIDKDGPPSA